MERERGLTGRRYITEKYHETYSFLAKKSAFKTFLLQTLYLYYKEPQVALDL